MSDDTEDKDKPMGTITTLNPIYDFNTAGPQVTDENLEVLKIERKERSEREKENLKDRMAANPLNVLQYLFPNGRLRAKEFLVGSLAGEKGKSLSINVDSLVWSDFAAGQSGNDLLGLWMGARRCDLPEALKQVRDFLGMGYQAPPIKKYKEDAFEGLPAPTKTWHYKDVTGERILAKVTRYDYPDGTKEFRQYDAVRGVAQAPEVRPLYNLQGISQAQHVVLVEGEKCADALIARGIPATSAMGGASTAIDKIDWSPLSGRSVVIWPDNDTPGMSYAQRAKAAIEKAGGTARILALPSGKPPKWDAADAVAEDGFDVEGFLRAGVEKQEEGPFKVDIISMVDLLKLDCPIKWYIEGLLGEKESLVIPGKSGIGKSLLTLDMALHIAMPQMPANACGLDFNPRANVLFEMFPIPRPLTSLFIQAENSVNATQFRIKKMIEHNPGFIDGLSRIKLPYLKENIRYPGDLANQEFRDSMLRMIEEHEVNIVFLDPLISYHGEDENDNGAMRRLLDNIDEIQELTNTSFVIIHHVGKNTVDNDVFPGRGASSIGDWSPNTLVVRPPQQELRNDSGELREILDCYHLKCRNAKRQGTFFMERGEDMLLRKIENPNEKKEKKSNTNIVVEVLSCVSEKYVESRKELLDLIVGTGKLKTSAAQTAINEAVEAGLAIAVPTFKNQVGYRLPEVRIQGFED